MTHVHNWSLWVASFIRFGFLGNIRKCPCGLVERRHLAGYGSVRCNAIVARLNASLVRSGKRFTRWE